MNKTPTEISLEKEIKKLKVELASLKQTKIDNEKLISVSMKDILILKKELISLKSRITDNESNIRYIRSKR
jgi:predicted  nucleic acid-binding Zn-ribbon protein